MRPALVTVVSARPWESALVAAAVAGARLRVVARVGHPSHLARALPHADVIVLGAEAPWFEPWILEASHAWGAATIGIHPRGDAVGARLVAGASVCFDELTPIDVLVSSAAFLGQSIASGSTERGSIEAPHTQRYSTAAGMTGR